MAYDQGRPFSISLQAQIRATLNDATASFNVARDAPSEGRRSSFAFPGLRRFHRLSCHSRPDRRGRIRHVTYRHWLLRSSPCCLRSPCLAVGVATNGVAQRLQRFHVLHSIREKLGPLCYTGSPESARRATLDDPDSTACHFGPSLKQPRMARFL